MPLRTLPTSFSAVEVGPKLEHPADLTADPILVQGSIEAALSDIGGCQLMHGGTQYAIHMGLTSAGHYIEAYTEGEVSFDE